MDTSSSTVQLSPTLQAVASEIGPDPCSARQLIVAVLDRHRDYAGGRPKQIVETLDWIPGGARRTPTDWYTEAATLLADPSLLNGKLAIVSVALLDRPSGRALTAAGVLQTLIADVKEGWSAFNDIAHGRADTIPLLGLNRGGGGPDRVLRSRSSADRGGLSADGRRAVLYGARTLSVVSVNSDVEILSVPVSQDPRMARIDDSGAVVVLMTDGSVERWNVERGVAQRTSTTAPIKGGAFGALSSLGTVAVVRRDDDASIVRVDTVNGDPTVIALDRPASRVAVSASGRSIAAAVNDEILWWPQWRDGAAPTVLTGNGVATTLDCSDRHVVAVTDSGLLVAGERLGELEPCDVSGARQINMSGNGQMFAVLNDRTVDVRDVRSGVRLAELTFGHRKIERVAFNLNSTRLLGVASNGMSVVWNVGVDPPPAPPVATDFSNDSAEAVVDLLGRSRDAEAFGALIASREMQPPLAIGVFGDWGSGKSWFMHEIRKVVASIADESARTGLPQRDLGFYKNIQQVVFNAWHYSETDVLASLADHIFKVLKEGAGSEFEKTRINLATQLAAAQSAVAAKASTAAEKEALLRSTKAELDASSRALEAKRDELFTSAVRDAPKGQLRETVLQLLANIGLGPASAAAGDLEAVIAEARAELRRGGRWITALADGDPTTRRRRRGLFVGFIAGPILGVLAAAILRRSAPVVPAISAIGTVVTAWCTTLAFAVRAHAVWLRSQLDSLTRFEADLWDSVANDKCIRALSEQVNTASQNVTKAQHAVANAQQDHAAALQTVEASALAIGELRPHRMLSDLISLRANERIYSKYLGVVAEARQDFQQMSDFVDLINSGTDGDGDGALNRIVLYIDDLDRCEPDKVVKVLQAVHLLLAFPLFVVVVGVDSRWVERALRDRYPGLLDSDGARPYDYLEKLFQIPVWLEPLTEDTARTMLRGVVGRPRSLARTATPPTTDPDVSPSPAPIGTSERPQVAVTHIRVLPMTRATRFGFTLDAHELASMEDLAGALGRSPRSLKRFANIYRLIKILSDDPAEFADQRPDADYRAVLLLVSILVGAPEHARAIFDAVRRGDGAPEDKAAFTLPHSWMIPPDQVHRWLQPWVNEVSRFGFQQLGDNDQRHRPERPAAMPG